MLASACELGPDGDRVAIHHSVSASSSVSEEVTTSAMAFICWGSPASPSTEQAQVGEAHSLLTEKPDLPVGARFASPGLAIPFSGLPDDDAT
jgi:hypothetical protein